MNIGEKVAYRLGVVIGVASDENAIVHFDAELRDEAITWLSLYEVIETIGESSEDFSAKNEQLSNEQLLEKIRSCIRFSPADKNFIKGV